MAIELLHFQASSQRTALRRDSLFVDHQPVSAQQIRAALAPAPAKPVPTVSMASEPSKASSDDLDLDPLTRLRRLIIQSLTASAARPVVSSVPHSRRETSPTPFIEANVFAKHTVGFSPAALNIAGGNMQNPEGSVLEFADIQVVREEREASWVHMDIAMEIDGFNLRGQWDIRQSRSSVQQLSVDLSELPNFLDPLVLNFEGPVQLSADVVTFDLDADGQLDRIARLASDSYLLVRDVNHNGKIDDGSEVIGALTGDGYGELRALDDNGDGFITAADSEWQSLRLWRPGDLSSGQSLAVRAVQIIGLQSISSPFQLTDPMSGKALGHVRQTGFFVADNKFHTSQQVDYIV